MDVERHNPADEALRASQRHLGPSNSRSALGGAIMWSAAGGEDEELLAIVDPGWRDAHAHRQHALPVAEVCAARAVRAPAPPRSVRQATPPGARVVDLLHLVGSSPRALRADLADTRAAWTALASAMASGDDAWIRVVADEQGLEVDEVVSEAGPEYDATAAELRGTVADWLQQYAATAALADAVLERLADALAELLATKSAIIGDPPQTVGGATAPRAGAPPGADRARRPQRVAFVARPATRREAGHVGPPSGRCAGIVRPTA